MFKADYSDDFTRPHDSNYTACLERSGTDVRIRVWHLADVLRSEIYQHDTKIQAGITYRKLMGELFREGFE